MPTLAMQRPTKAAGAVRNAIIDYTDELDTGDTGELLVDPTVAEVTTEDLTIESVAVNTGTKNCLGETVAVGKAVQFRVSGGTKGRVYTLRVTVDTDATPAQTFVDDFQFLCN